MENCDRPVKEGRFLRRATTGSLTKKDRGREAPIDSADGEGKGVAKVTCEPCCSFEEIALVLEISRVRVGKSRRSCSGLAIGSSAASAASKTSMNLDGRVAIDGREGCATGAPGELTCTTDVDMLLSSDPLYCIGEALNAAERVVAIIG